MKSQNKITRKRRAVSPVIATVILVAVAITVAVAVSYWMAGISGQYTSFEKIELSTVLTSVDPFGNWQIDIDLKNSGTSTATINAIYVNDGISSPDSLAPAANVDTITSSLTTLTLWQLTPGDSNSLSVWIGGPGTIGPYLTLSPGTTVSIKIHSAAGMDYFKLVKLP